MLCASWSRSPWAFVFLILSLPARSQLKQKEVPNELYQFIHVYLHKETCAAPER